MTKFEIKERLRKIRWATEHETGKRLGKKGLIEVQKVVMQMQAKQPVQEVSLKTNWKERPQVLEAEKIKVDLAGLIGKKF